MAMLDRRAQILLKTLVERYIAEGQPVGSRALSRYSGLDLSPATIRNIMSDLEELGFISSPHTSAGRIPTPRGYRIFVDSLLTIKPLEQVELSQIEGNLHPDNPQRLISSASQLLSQLSHFAGVVASPRRKSAAFRHIEFLAPVGKTHPAHHRHPGRRRAEPDPVYRSKLYPGTAHHGGKLPQPELCRDLRSTKSGRACRRN